MPLANAGANIASSDQISDGIIVNADIDAAAAIEGSKLKTLNVGVEAGVIPSTGIDNADVAANAAIDESKISGAVDKTSAESVGGVKTFTSDPIVPAEAYGAGWSGDNSPPTKDALYTKIQSLASVDYTNIVGALTNAVVKTYFNIILPFIMWTGAVANDTTTTFINWIRTATSAVVNSGGTMVDFQGTGALSIYLNDFFIPVASTVLKFDATNIVILDWWAKLPASGTGDISMGFWANTDAIQDVYTNTTYNRVVFSLSAAGALYATICKGGTGVTNTNISSGITLTNWNNYRIELDLSNNALFYVNGVLKATLSGANFPTIASMIAIVFGRSNTSLFQVTAPTLSLQMNP